MMRSESNSPGCAGVLRCTLCGTPALELDGPLLVDESEERNSVHGLLCPVCWAGVQWVRCRGLQVVAGYFGCGVVSFCQMEDADGV